MNLTQFHEKVTEGEFDTNDPVSGKTGIKDTPTSDKNFINVKVPIPKGAEMKQRELADFVMTQIPGITASGRSFEAGLKFYDNQGHMCKLVQQEFNTVLTGTQDNKVFMQRIAAVIGQYYNQLKRSDQLAQTQNAQPQLQGQ